ncbi:MAG: SDR family oxidoreductase [Planctomycetota bacterium]
MFDVCHLGAVRSPSVLPGMVRRGRGLVVQVASAAALRAFPGIAAYGAAKHALLGWSAAAALELRGTGAAVASIRPYDGEGAMLERAAEGMARDLAIPVDEARRRFAARNPGGALVRPEAVGEVALALFDQARLDPDAASGRVVVLDGGPPRPPDPKIDRTAPVLP